MTLSEFKAWFEGFTENIDGTPSGKQWEKIQARVKEISGTPVTYPVYIDRYLRDYRYSPPYYGSHPYYQGLSVYNTMQASTNNTASQNAVTAQQLGAAYGMQAHLNKSQQVSQFDSHTAMNALGRADAKSFN